MYGLNTGEANPPLRQPTVQSAPANENAAAGDPDVLKKVAEINDKIGGDGRVLLRESGTEPVIRVMVESESEALCDDYIAQVCAVIRKKGYISE